MSGFLEVTQKLFQGFGQNCMLFALTLVFALPLGLLVCMGSRCRFSPIRYLTRAFVWVIRGTPLMLQLFVVLYIPGLIFGMPFRSRMAAALIAFVINYAAYFSEIYRGGIESIERGQYEAAQALGLSKGKIFIYIVFPQMIKRILAPVSNEILTLVKDTSLARVIAVPEILMASTEFTAKGLIWPLFYSGAFFLIFCGAVTLLMSYFQKKLSYYDA